MYMVNIITCMLSQLRVYFAIKREEMQSRLQGRKEEKDFCSCYILQSHFYDPTFYTT